MTLGIRMKEVKPSPRPPRACVVPGAVRGGRRFIRRPRLHGREGIDQNQNHGIGTLPLWLFHDPPLEQIFGRGPAGHNDSGQLDRRLSLVPGGTPSATPLRPGKNMTGKSHRRHGSNSSTYRVTSPHRLPALDHHRARPARSTVESGCRDDVAGEPESVPPSR